MILILKIIFVFFNYFIYPEFVLSDDGNNRDDFSNKFPSQRNESQYIYYIFLN